MMPLASGLPELLSPFLKNEQAPGPGAYTSVSLEGLFRLAAALERPVREAMILCLEEGIWPARFCRNRGVLSAESQAALLRSRVAVLGCGGLGGHVITLLARLGVGMFSLCDNDVFEESNLNRQCLCREDRLGRNKAEAATDELVLTASHAEIAVFAEKADERSLPAILQGARIAVDCLDHLPSRRMAEAAARAVGIPFVHGSIAGQEGFAFCEAATDGSTALRRLYPEDPPREDMAEYRLGVPTLPPAAVAVLQCGLVLNELTGRAVHPGEPVLWHLDLSVPELEKLVL